jgi:hypothetical protein
MFGSTMFHASLGMRSASFAANAADAMERDICDLDEESLFGGWQHFNRA